jgi:hypothetical protein
VQAVAPVFKAVLQYGQNPAVAALPIAAFLHFPKNGAM